MNKEIEIPEGYEARIEGNKVIIELKESEDDMIRKRLINLIKELAAAKIPISTSGYFVDGQDKDYIAYLEKQKEQKPAEWSEEDETMLEAICTIIRMSGPVESSAKEKIDWLKSLRPQPKQEVVDRNVFNRIADILRWCDLPIGCPVEDFKQSESEREHLLDIVQCVAHRYANSCTYCKEYSRGYQDGLAVHHWKPSEEQMDALGAVVGMIHPLDKRYDAIFGLLKELKALSL